MIIVGIKAMGRKEGSRNGENKVMVGLGVFDSSLGMHEVRRGDWRKKSMCGKMVFWERDE